MRLWLLLHLHQHQRLLHPLRLHLPLLHPPRLHLRQHLLHHLRLLRQPARSPTLLMRFLTLTNLFLSQKAKPSWMT